MADKLIECTNLSFSYDGKKVSSDISFEVCEGDYLCIVGRNGSGKSTLINGLLGLKKQDEGQIKFTNMKRQDIGFLPQRTDVQNDFPASAWEVVLTGTLAGTSFMPFLSKGAAKRANEAMESLKIADLKNMSFRDLSGGQRQRVLLARAFCAAKKVLLLDEPTSGLDAASTEELYASIDEIRKEHGLAIISVTHDLEHVINKAGSVLLVEEESVFYKTREAFTADKSAEDFLKGEYLR